METALLATVARPIGFSGERAPRWRRKPTSDSSCRLDGISLRSNFESRSIFKVHSARSCSASIPRRSRASVFSIHSYRRLRTIHLVGTCRGIHVPYRTSTGILSPVSSEIWTTRKLRVGAQVAKADADAGDESILLHTIAQKQTSRSKRRRKEEGLLQAPGGGRALAPPPPHPLPSFTGHCSRSKWTQKQRTSSRRESHSHLSQVRPRHRHTDGPSNDCLMRSARSTCPRLGHSNRCYRRSYST
jgi:hypothetical protein